MIFFIVDAFTDQVFGGNPAGVVLLDGDFPSDELMTKTAAELRYSETAFVKPLSEREFQIRYFTPASEVELCGHATIGSFVALERAGLLHGDGEYINHTKAGKLKIMVKDGYVMMEMGEPKILGEINAHEKLVELYRVMGLDGYERHIVQKTFPRLVSTGLPDIMLPVASVADLDAIKPDFPALSKLSQEYGVVGVHAFALSSKYKSSSFEAESDLQGKKQEEVPRQEVNKLSDIHTEDEHANRGISEIIAHCRNFAPLYEIDEEAATGTSNGALTYYLREAKIIPAHAECAFLQGEAMGRPSIIRSEIEGERIMVGGSAVILAQGEVYI